MSDMSHKDDGLDVDSGDNCPHVKRGGSITHISNPGWGITYIWLGVT